MRFAMAIIALIVSLTQPRIAHAATEDLPLAVRIMSYGDYQDDAWSHLPSIGVNYLFMGVPEADAIETTQQKLRAHGLTPLVFRGSADLSKETFAEELAPQLAVCEAMGVKYLFLSAKRGDASKEAAYARLRAAGEVAKAHGVIITLETHPDLGTNGDVQVETMQAVDHPNIRVNFDTANITYYNRNTDAIAELKKSIDYVATVELKDHTGGFESWDFPVLGRGIVGIPSVLALLRAAKYAGPITIEFEGTEGVTLNREDTLEAIAESVAWARWARRMSATDYRIHSPVLTQPSALPQVLIIGDSISVGYTPAVAAALEGIADVAHNPGNARHSGWGREHLEEWLGKVEWDVIHFNFGLHDLKYVDAEGNNVTTKEAGEIQVPLPLYRDNLEAIVTRLKETGAALIFATTTPFPEGVGGPLRHVDDVAAYNDAAVAVMQTHGVAVNDLHASAAPRLGELQRPNNVHFTDAGSRALGEQVAETIRAALAR